MTDRDFSAVAEHGGIGGYEPKFVDVNGTRTRYYDIGAGDPLVLLHGGNWGAVMNANAWWPSFEYLSQRFRVIAIDRMACGLTDNPDDVEDYHWLTELEHALNCLAELDIDQCHIAGFSRGGGLATRMVLEDPDRFETLFILNSSTFGPQAGDRGYRGDRIFERDGPEYAPTSPEYTRFFYEQYAYRTDHITDEFCRTNAWIRSQPTPRQTAEIMRQGRNPIYQETKREQMWGAHRRIKEGELTTPTLYLFGRNDLTVRLEQGIAAFDMIAQHNRNVRLRLINHCAHLIPMEVPEEFGRAVSDFVDLMH